MITAVLDAGLRLPRSARSALATVAVTDPITHNSPRLPSAAETVSLLGSVL
jgi:hypothetical protein